MTTLRRELRTKIEDVLFKQNIFSTSQKDREELAELIADSVLEVSGVAKRSQSDRLEEAKERIAKQRASKKDPLDFFVENGKEIQMLNDMRIRVEAATGLGLSREWDKTRSPWNGYEKVLIKREVETGQTIEQFMTWYNSDDFRKKGNIWLDPDKIEKFWTQAFVKSAQPTDQPQAWQDEDWRNVELG